MFRWILLVFTIVACNDMFAQQDFDKKVKSLLNNTVPQITSSELDTLLQKNPNLILLDTRSTEEYKVSKIASAKFIDYDDFEPQMVQGIDKDEQIVVYCSVGYRSEKIGEKLQEMGYNNVLNLYGGIFDWKNTDHVVINENQQPTDSVHTYNKNWSKYLNKGVKVYD
ncbi:rhodanese-like domain-containing protein [Fulvivirga lutea]|uniref:Rhodanese-like domain-containing protein n=1 Tax=Fulvivirga lutea TaxID=2810512 RepID=A0A974WG79_9BACT|nr:rhodanese-like domain-containing protein [Fulvivirga lutea]QSE97470.1 rhodanese-like domain-containing protein [Fulvivirga lutea]